MKDVRNVLIVQDAKNVLIVQDARNVLIAQDVLECVSVVIYIVRVVINAVVSVVKNLENAAQDNANNAQCAVKSVRCDVQNVAIVVKSVGNVNVNAIEDANVVLILRFWTARSLHIYEYANEYVLLIKSITRIKNYLPRLEKGVIVVGIDFIIEQSNRNNKKKLLRKLYKKSNR